MLCLSGFELNSRRVPLMGHRKLISYFRLGKPGIDRHYSKK